MRGYEDLIAGLCLLVVVLVGGYVYLDSQVYKQKQVLKVPVIKKQVSNSDKTMFEVASKTTE